MEAALPPTGLCRSYRCGKQALKFRHNDAHSSSFVSAPRVLQSFYSTENVWQKSPAGFSYRQYQLTEFKQVLLLTYTTPLMKLVGKFKRNVHPAFSQGGCH